MSFNVCAKMFVRLFVESAICFAAICWGSSIRAGDSKKLNKEGWIGAGDCSGARGPGQVDEYQEQHCPSSS